MVFLLTPYANLDQYGKNLIQWHHDQCSITRVIDFSLFFAQHAFLLIFANFVATSVLQDPRGIKELRMPVDFADYGDEVHAYVTEVLDEAGSHGAL